MSADRVDGTAVRAHRRGAGPLGTVLEPKQGYRFGPENLTIGAALPARAPRVLDIGAGCGVLGLLAHVYLGANRTVLLEQNGDLAAFSQNNAAAHEGAEVVRADAREWRPSEEFDLIVTNPPFFPVGAGRESDNPMVRDATHTHRGDLASFLAAGAALLAPKGHVVVLYPADGLPDVLVELSNVGLRPNDITFVYARHTAQPYRAWVRADCVGAVLDAPRVVSPAALKR